MASELERVENVNTEILDDDNAYKKVDEVLLKLAKDSKGTIMTLDYNLISISDEVSAQGGAKSIKMQYKSYNSVSYVRNTQIAHNAEARGIVLDIKGDGYATVYININLRSGTSTVKLRYALSSIPTTWTRYELGYHLFQGITEATASKKIYASDTKDIESISFGIVDNNHYTVSNIYIDNLKLSKVIAYTANNHSSIS